MHEGKRLAWFLDDLLVLAKSLEQSLSHTREFVEFLECMGFTINYKSAPWPSCQATCLGLRLDTVSTRVTLTQERWETTRTVLALFVPGACVRYHTIKRLLGLLASAHQVVPLGLLFIRRLQLRFVVYLLKYGNDRKYNNKLIRVPA